MAAGERKPSSERRAAILDASLELFARHGHHGVTTRMIADAAGISEALLYRHFRGKDELFTELQRWCLRDTMGAAQRLVEAGASTRTLVRGVYLTVHQILAGREARPGAEALKRIMLGSLVGDGVFARGFVEVNFSQFIPFFAACLEAAHRSGDLVAKSRNTPVRVWMVHNLAVMVSNMMLPDPPVIDYGLRPEALLDEVVQFSLRGLGLTEAALATHYDGKELAAFTRSLLPNPLSPTSAPPAAPARRKTERNPASRPPVASTRKKS